MTQNEKEKLRASTLYANEKLKVIYEGKSDNFPKNTEIEVNNCAVKHSGLKFPQPKWTPCDYYIIDLDGDRYPVAKERYGELAPGFKWIKE